jgi:glutamate/aspartate transport system substrate-binding protein
MKYTIALIVLISMLITGTSSAGDTSTLEQIKNSETIRIGYRETEPPMSFLNKDKQPIGYSVELCLHIVNEVKSILKNPILLRSMYPSLPLTALKP